MTIIDKLNQTVTASVLDENNSVAYLSLLEQFYAILIARLAQPALYSQLLADNHLVEEALDVKPSLFEQLWHHHQRQLLIDELATTHHIDSVITEQFVIKAADTAYQQLHALADGQFLPAFLQAQQTSIRPYLPVWSDAVIETVEPLEAIHKASAELADNHLTDNYSTGNYSTGNYSPEHRFTDSPLTADTRIDNTSRAIHGSPLDYHDKVISKNSTKAPPYHIDRSKKNPLILGLTAIAILVAAGLVWALVTRFEPEAEAGIETSPAASATNETPTNEPASPVESLSAASNLPQLKPVELKVGVDNQGELYSCTASVGSTELQDALKEALRASFGTQANACELLLQEETASHLSNIDITTLSKIFTLLRSVPFARLQLQNDTFTVEAPDEALLQFLVTDLKVLAPTIAINSVAPLPLAEPSLMESDETSLPRELDSNIRDEASINNNLLNGNNDLSAGSMERNLNDLQSQPRQQSKKNINSSFDDSGFSDAFENSANSENSYVPAEGLSAAEVDNLANSTIVAEKLHNERPIN